MLPEGFSDLVAVTIENWDWDVLPEEDAEVWDALLYPVFLGRTVRSAQASYVKEVLDSYLTMDAARTIRTDPYWSKKVMKTINSELGSIAGTPGEGLKRAILNTVAQDVRNLNLSRTLDTALSFFERFDIDVAKIKNIRNDDNGTKELVDYATREIYNVSYIKAVLWLYDCGIAYNLVPPNSHVKRFLAECGYPGFGWSRDDEPEDWQIFALACNKMSEVAQQVATGLNKHISAKQAQAAVWYLQTCRGLLPRKYARRLSPRTLIDFLQNQRWDIGELAERLSDVEKLEGLTEDLKNFLEATL
jgi:hypothetical protein